MPICTHCARHFVDSQALLMHTKSKHQSRYECNHCNRTFKTSEGRDQHEEVKHSGYECSYCDRVFKTLEGRDKHEESKHPNYECNYCNRTFKTSEGRDQHEEVKHPRYECSYCDRAFKSSEGRDQHEESKHPDYECSYCNCIFKTSEGRDQHEESKHPDYECRYCDKEFSSAEGRAQHEKSKHARPSIVYSSPYQPRNPVPCSLVQATAARPAPVEQPRIDVVLDSLPTRKFTPAPPDDRSEVAPDVPSDNHGDAPADDHSDTPSDDHSDAPADDHSDAPSEDHSDASDDDCSDAPSEDHSDASDDDYSDTPSDDHSDASADDRSDAPSDDHSGVFDDNHSEVSYDGYSEVSIKRGTAPKPIANFACGTCGEHFMTISALESHELRRHTEPCACKICERAGEPCSCGICKRASTVTTLVGDEKSLVNNKPEETGFFVDTLTVIEPEVMEDLSIEPRNSIITAEFRDSVDPLYDELRDVAEDTKVLQHAIILLDVEHVADEEPSFDSPPGNENDSLDPPTCHLDFKKEGITPNSYVVPPECVSVICEMDMSQQHTTEAASVDARLVMVTMDDHACRDLPIDTVNSKTQDYSVAPAEAWDDQQTIPDADIKHQLINDPPTLFDPCIPELEHDNESSLHSANPLMDSLLVQCCSPQCIGPPQLYTSDPGLHELDDLSTRDQIPSPTPSEQGSLRLSIVQESHSLEGGPPLSPSTSEGSADYFSDIDPSSTPSSPFSERSIVFVSAESIPEYLRENRAYLVATSAPSRPSSAASSCIRLPSVATSLDSMPPQDDPVVTEAPLADAAPTNSPSRLYCRICLQDPCDDLTATMCGHVFCNRCIIDVVIARSACPVCNAPTLLYCLFRLDI